MTHFAAVAVLEARELTLPQRQAFARLACRFHYGFLVDAQRHIELPEPALALLQAYIEDKVPSTQARACN